jgi:hypothetical protein
LLLKADPAGDRAKLAKQAMALRAKAAALRSRREAEATEIRLRVACRERALERHRTALAYQRRLDRDEVDASHFAEARAMATNDAESSGARRYLSCAWAEIKALEQAYVDFDLDKSGTIDVAELQLLMFSAGFELDDEAAESLAAKLDRDGSGSIDFWEFCAWWLVSEGTNDLGLDGGLSKGSLPTAGAGTLDAPTRKRLLASMKQRDREKKAAHAKALLEHSGVDPAARAANERKAARDEVDAARKEATARGDVTAHAVAHAQLHRRTLTRLPKKP